MHYGWLTWPYLWKSSLEDMGINHNHSQVSNVHKCIHVSYVNGIAISFHFYISTIPFRNEDDMSDFAWPRHCTLFMPDRDADSQVNREMETTMQFSKAVLSMAKEKIEDTGKSSLFPLWNPSRTQY